ncbi:MlaD family protein [Conexibacter sp. SYSU D00693]|uniref:MlaD family protein n=1 Tax=Conexibacter sp. SYSU D00693 TaxID=2812560 RepID=UPI00196A5739|nr:MlaD family protein [Conexibacter sp. SYSU D00693]
MGVRRPQSSIVANPVLVGALTVLVVVVAVFLSYNANSGLPFVPTYKIDVVVPDAAQVVPGNDVRIGGSRVGVVTEVEAEPGPDGTPAARLQLALEKAAEPLPVDTRAMVRLRSNLGLKYVELRPGDSTRDLPAGGEIGLRQSTGVVDFDDAISAFDAPTRDALKGVVRDLGTGLAGREADVGRTIEELPRTSRSLRSVAALLRSPRTDLPGFLRSAESAAAALAPVSQPLGSLMRAGARTFSAIADEDAAVDATLAQAPEVTRVSTAGFRAARPIFAQAAGLLRDAAPGVRVLSTSATRLANGLRAAGPALRDARPLARDLQPTLDALRTLATRPSTTRSLTNLTPVVADVDHALQTIAPMQTRCNYLGLWGRNVPSVVSEGDRMGTWFRFIPIVELSEDLQSPRPAANNHRLIDEDTGAGGECEPGNETYFTASGGGPAPGTQPGRTETTSPPAEARR